MSKLKIEYKSYGLYGEIAKNLGTTVEKVSKIYEWYIKKNNQSFFHDDETLKVRYKSLGFLKFSAKNAVLFVGEFVYVMNRIIKSFDESYDEETNTLTMGRNTFFKHYNWERQKLCSSEVIEVVRYKLKKAFESGYITEDNYNYNMGRIEKFEPQVKEIYEHIQRILKIDQNCIKEQ